MTPSTIRVGTSGFSYKEWKGSFYPEDLPVKQYLSFYAQHFSTTEINNTFYRIPTKKLTESWASEVPDDFSFTLKLSQKITHFKRLKNAEEEMDLFLDAASGLGNKLGPVLVQLPPNFKKDADVLEEFLDRYAKKANLAFEFRNASWMNSETYDLLRKYNTTLGVVEGEDVATVRQVTGKFVYMRLRKGDYTLDELKQWADWIQAQPVAVYCYLKHDEKAPVLAKQLLGTLSASDSY